MKLNKILLTIACVLMKKALALLFFVLLVFTANTLYAQCMDVSGEWNYSQTGTVTSSVAGESFTEDISDSGRGTIIQNGCNATFSVDGETVMTGTILGNRIQMTGELMEPEDGFTLIQNILTGSGTISADARNITLTASGYASGTYEGYQFTVRHA